MSATWLGAERVDLASCASTNDEAARLAKDGAAHGTVVTARAQTAGRGRGGHEWFSPDAGNLYLSAVLRPKLEPRFVPPITLAAGIGVCEAVNHFGPCPSLKWPNDVLIGGRKVSGILTEMSSREGVTEHVVLGIGVNVNGSGFPPELEAIATSVALETGRAAIDRERFLAVLLGALERWLDRFFVGGIAAISEHWTDRANFAGRWVRVQLEGEQPVVGKASGLDSDGALLVIDEGGERHRVIAGDVEVLSQTGRFGPFGPSN